MSLLSVSTYGYYHPCFFRFDPLQQIHQQPSLDRMQALDRLQHNSRLQQQQRSAELALRGADFPQRGAEFVHRGAEFGQRSVDPQLRGMINAQNRSMGPQGYGGGGVKDDFMLYTTQQPHTFISNPRYL